MQKIRISGGMLSNVRRDFPTTYASRTLPCYVLASTPNQFMNDK